jgi:hypothetical protein
MELAAEGAGNAKILLAQLEQIVMFALSVAK